MTEHIGTNDLLCSGGHVWEWSEPALAEKRMRTVGTQGEARMVLHVGGWPFRIVGKGGDAPLLRATGADQAAADSAMNAILDAIWAVRNSIVPVAWEDDTGESGSFLAILHFRPQQREYGFRTGACDVWVRYTLEGEDLSGRTG